MAMNCNIIGILDHHQCVIWTINKDISVGKENNRTVTKEALKEEKTPKERARRTLVTPTGTVLLRGRPIGIGSPIPATHSNTG